MSYKVHCCVGVNLGTNELAEIAVESPQGFYWVCVGHRDLLEAHKSLHEALRHLKTTTEGVL